MHEKRTGLALLSLVGLILATLGAMVVPASAAAPGTLGASMGAATVAPDPVVRSSGEVTISATVTGTYSADGTPSAASVDWSTPTPGTYGTCTKGANTYIMNQSAPATRTKVIYVDKGLVVDETVIHAETKDISETVDLTGLADGTRSATVDAVVQAFQTPRTVIETTTYYRYWDGTKAVCGVQPDNNWVESSHNDASTVYSTATTLSASDTYVLDLVAPVVEASFSGGGAAEAPTGGSINANIKISQGRPNDGFKLTLSAYPWEIVYEDDGSGGILLDESGDPIPVLDEFGNPVTVLAETPAFSEWTNGTIGNNGQEYFASIGLDVPCGAALGDYDLVVVVEKLTDRGGSDFDDVVKTAGTFEVVPSTNLVGTTQVFGWVDVDGDGLPDYTNLDSGFSATQGGKVVNTAPGAFFATSLLKATGQCTGQTTMNFASANNDATYDVTLTAPEGFAFVITGQRYTRVYAGKDVQGALFDWERPGLIGVSATGDVTSMLGTGYEWVNSSTNPTVVKVKLGKLTYWVDSSGNGIYGDAGDTLKKGGALPADWKVFVKVRLRYIGTEVPALGQSFQFDGMVHVDGYNGAKLEESKINSYYLVRTA